VGIDLNVLNLPPPGDSEVHRGPRIPRSDAAEGP
jgi:hypothetical protein